jgi:hypothetical protein
MTAMSNDQTIPAAFHVVFDDDVDHIEFEHFATRADLRARVNPPEYCGGLEHEREANIDELVDEAWAGPGTYGIACGQHGTQRVYNGGYIHERLRAVARDAKAHLAEFSTFVTPAYRFRLSPQWVMCDSHPMNTIKTLEDLIPEALHPEEYAALAVLILDQAGINLDVLKTVTCFCDDAGVGDIAKEIVE